MAQTTDKDLQSQTVNIGSKGLLHRDNEKLLTREILSAATHDFNEPLRTISGYCDLILNNRNSDLPPKYKEWIEAIQSSASRAEDLADTVAEFASYQLNDIKLDRKNFNTLLMSVHRESQLQFPGCEIQCHLKSVADITINTDSELFETALLNIIKNACVYSFDRNPKVHISTKVNDKEMVCVLIRNRGKKIPIKFQHKIFTPFFRLHSYHKIPGHGLGLSMSKRIMKNLDGDLWLEYSTDEETCFIMTHPLP